MSRQEGRAEIKGIRDDTDGALVDLIGEPSTEALKDRLSEWLDQRDGVADDG